MVVANLGCGDGQGQCFLLVLIVRFSFQTPSKVGVWATGVFYALQFYSLSKNSTPTRKAGGHAAKIYSCS